MIKLTLVELFLRVIPESFLIIFAAYLLNNKTINKKLYFASSILLSISIYLVRMLPIAFGVHSIIGLCILVCILVKLNKFSIMKSISSTLVITMLLSFCEFINVLIIEKILNLDIKVIFRSTFDRIAYLTPSLLLFICAISIFYKLTTFQKKTPLASINEDNVPLKK